MSQWEKYAMMAWLSVVLMRSEGDWRKWSPASGDERVRYQDRLRAVCPVLASVPP